MMWREALKEVLALPRARWREALRRLREGYAFDSFEEWNTAFGPNSLYEAWSTIAPMQGLYRHNREVIRNFLASRRAWHIVEIGGGNGALWRGFFDSAACGRFTLIDPVASAHDAVAAALPGGIAFRSIVAPAEETEIPDADVVVCSLMLHHVAGLDSAQRRIYGLDGPGKHELLQRFLAGVRARKGICILNESDVYTEIDLPPEDPILIDRLIDSYVSRAGRAVAEAIERPGNGASLKRRLEAVLIRWCIDQVEIAGCAPRTERDVYELDTPFWLHVLARAGAHMGHHRFTDDWRLFHQHVFTNPG